MVLGWTDYLVIAAYVVGITAFGSYFARFQKSRRDYFLSDRSVPWWAVCFTVVATETSTLTFIGVPAAAYAGNMTFLQIVIGYILGRIVISALFIPAYFKGELFTSYELLRQRLGSVVKNLSAIVFLVTRSLADGIRLFATALVIAVVTGVPVPVTILITGAVMIVIATRGGVAAVIWTDVVQLFVYVAGALVVFVALLNRIPGGWSEMIAVGAAAGKFRVIDLSVDVSKPYTLWAGILGGMALTLSTHGTDQFLVQRLLAARSARDAARGLILSGVLVLGQFGLFLMIGVMLYTFYQHHPLTAPLSRNDAILPTFIIDQLQGGPAGFIMAAIVAAALSPSLNAMAATTVNDFYLIYVRSDADERRLMWISRAATVLWGVVQIGVALAAQLMTQSVLDAGLSVLSLASGSVLGAFLIGTLMPGLSRRATVAGMVAGMAVMAWVWTATTVAFTWYVLIGTCTTIAVAWCGSWWRSSQPLTQGPGKK
ncbi:MAG: sodium/solute symporter [Acidobacteria bacterium]|nr:sodium/solute symporter [Acidobacteriota bacterium]